MEIRQPSVLAEGDPIHVVAFGDYVDRDFLAALEVATGTGMNVVLEGVVTTPRHVNPNPDTENPKDASGFDPEASGQRHLLSTAMLAGALVRSGVDPGSVPFFMGVPVGRQRFEYGGETIGVTQSKTIIPHIEHIDERLLIPGLTPRQATTWPLERLLAHPPMAQGLEQIRGDFKAALDHIRSVALRLEAEGKKLHVLAGGPLTEIGLMLRLGVPEINRNLGVLALQGMLRDIPAPKTQAERGVYGNEGDRYSGSFNMLCDADAADDVLTSWPGEIVAIHSTLTRHPDASFRDVQEMQERLALGRGASEEEILREYRPYRRLTDASGRQFNRRIPPVAWHDALGLLLLCQRVRGANWPFDYQEVTVPGRSTDYGRTYQAESVNDPEGLKDLLGAQVVGR